MSVIENLQEVKQAMDYEDRISLRNNVKTVIDKLTPDYHKGDTVKHLESGNTFQVCFRQFDLDHEIIFYLDGELNFCYSGNELELVQRKESE